MTNSYENEGNIELSVSDFVALHNQIMEMTMPLVTVVGELANFRVSKNRWIYFDLKDDTACVKFFGSVYALNGPLEDGMMLRVVGSPRLHPLYGFSVSVQSIFPAGEGSIRRAADLLKSKLTAEGLFDTARKRPLPYPPERIGIITSRQSAAYADFTKILSARWSGLEIILADVQVQGDAAVAQIVQAIDDMNSLPEPPEVLVLTRGGGSAEDLWVFSSEAVTRAVATSRIPTLVAVGHEVDISLAELAADQRASTPSNAAELLTPDKQHILANIRQATAELDRGLELSVTSSRRVINDYFTSLEELTQAAVRANRHRLELRGQMLDLLNPGNILRRGYAIVRSVDGRIVRSGRSMAIKTSLDIEFQDGHISVEVQ